jgi:hypothetical protein
MVQINTQEPERLAYKAACPSFPLSPLVSTTQRATNCARGKKQLSPKLKTGSEATLHAVKGTQAVDTVDAGNQIVFESLRYVILQSRRCPSYEDWSRGLSSSSRKPLESKMSVVDPNQQSSSKECEKLARVVGCRGTPENVACRRQTEGRPKPCVPDRFCRGAEDGKKRE